MKEERYDVCIVGAGLAGSTLAYLLSEERGVCIIEKKPIEDLGFDACGNAVHKNWFTSNKTRPKPSEFDAVATEIDKISLNLSEKRMEKKLEDGRKGIEIDKSKFVKGAFNSSLDHGTDFIRGGADPVFNGSEMEKVNVNGTSVEADVFVDASGVSAVLRNHFFKTPDGSLFRGYREIVDSELSEKRWNAFQYDSNAAYWAFPLDSKTNVGGVVFRDDADLTVGVQYIKKKLGLSNSKVEDASFGTVPSYKPIDLVYGNVVAIGDAGFTVNPITGGGIGPTVKATNILANSLKNGDGVKKFEERYLNQVGNGYKKNYWLRMLYFKLQPLFWRQVASWAFSKLYGGKEKGNDTGDEKKGF